MSAWLKDHTLLCFSFHFFDLSFSSSLLASRLAVGFERLLLCFGEFFGSPADTIGSCR